MTRPLAVAVDVSPVRPGTGGVGRYVTDLLAHLPPVLPTPDEPRARHWPTDDAKGERSIGGAQPLSVVPLTNRPTAWAAWLASAQPSEAPRVALAPAPAAHVRRPTLLWLQIEVPRVVCPPVDVVHYTTGRAALAAAAPSVLTVHDTWILDAPAAFPFRERLLAGVWLRASIPRARRIICVSNATARAVRRRWPAAADRTTVVRPGVAERWLAPAPPLPGAIRAAVGARWWLHVGRCTARKNVETLVEAFALALPGVQGEMPVLALVGPPGDADGSVRAAATRLGVTEHVRWLGAVDDRTLHGLYAGAELTACVGAYEGFGLTALEALACGCPVVRTGAGGLPEAAPAGALVAESAGAAAIARQLVAICGDPERRAALSDAGRRFGASRGAAAAAGETAMAYVAAATAPGHGLAHLR